MRYDMSVLHWNGCPELGTTVRRGHDRQRAANGFDPVPHQRQAKAEVASGCDCGCRDLESDAVVADRTGKRRLGLSQDDTGACRARMLGDVREPFLYQTVEDALYCTRTW